MEKPPSNEIEALERWNIARKDFNAKLKKMQELQKKAQKAYEAIIRKPIVTKRAEEALLALTLAKQELGSAEEKLNIARINSKNALESEKKAVEDRLACDRMRPGFFCKVIPIAAVSRLD